jgi:hypothetical protein
MFDILHDHLTLLLVGQFPSGPGSLAIAVVRHRPGAGISVGVMLVLRTSPIPWLQRMQVVITVVRRAPDRTLSFGFFIAHIDSIPHGQWVQQW